MDLNHRRFAFKSEDAQNNKRHKDKDKESDDQQWSKMEPASIIVIHNSRIPVC